MRRRRSILWISLIMTLLISMATVNVPLSTGSPGTAVLSAPLIRDSDLITGSTFSVNITVADVSEFWGYMFTLSYDPNVLTAVSAAPWPPPPYPIYFPPFYQPLPSKINNTAGYVQLAAGTYYADPVGVETTKPMPIAQINFTVQAEGESVLDLHDTKLLDIHGDEMDHTVVDGDFSSTGEIIPPPIHDVAVIDLTPSPNVVKFNDSSAFVMLSVSVKNKGNRYEKFDVSVLYNVTLIDTKTVTPDLGPEETRTMTFRWDTGLTPLVPVGTYTMSANASIVPGETSTADNKLIDGEVRIASDLHDVYIYGVTATPTPPSKVVVGENVTIYVTVGNKGTYNETFTVAVYLNETTTGAKIEFELKTVTDLAPDIGFPTITFSFTWETAGVALGNYKIIANASVVPDEINEANNVYVDGKLTVVAEVHDIAVTSVTAPSAVVLGDPVTIDVELKNEGNVLESFTLNVLYDGDSIESRSVSLGAGATKTESFTWDTIGVALGTYTITAEVPAVPGETDTDDNVETTSVTVAVRDIAIVSVTASKTQVTIGESITIHVTVKNEGNAFPESFSLTAKYDNIVIETQSYTNLPKGASKTFSFTWDTTGINVGTYTLSANASVVPGEKPEDQADNTYTGGTVTLKWWRSTISMSVSSTTVTIGGSITINGSISPTRVGVAVTIWQRLSGTETWNNITVVQTNENSQYTFEWKPTTAGDYEVKASWEGDAETFGDESDPQTIAVQEAPPSISLYAVAGIAVVIVMAIVLVYVLRVRKPKPT